MSSSNNKQEDELKRKAKKPKTSENPPFKEENNNPHTKIQITYPTNLNPQPQTPSTTTLSLPPNPSTLTQTTAPQNNLFIDEDIITHTIIVKEPTIKDFNEVINTFGRIKSFFHDATQYSPKLSALYIAFTDKEIYEEVISTWNDKFAST
jgi:hypothetical protein